MELSKDNHLPAYEVADDTTIAQRNAAGGIFNRHGRRDLLLGGLDGLEPGECIG